MIGPASCLRAAHLPDFGVGSMQAAIDGRYAKTSAPRDELATLKRSSL
jgi:hypothetical protein